MANRATVSDGPDPRLVNGTIDTPRAS